MSDEPPRFRDSVGHPRGLDVLWWCLPACLAAIGFGLLPLRSWDYWWHITMGRMVDAWATVPATNKFLYTMQPDAPSFIQPWLSEWVLFASHKIFPVAGGLLIRTVLAVAVISWLTATAIRRARDVVPGAATTVVGLFFLLGLLELRPHLFALPLFALGLWTIDAVRSDRCSSLVGSVIFAGLGVAWANLHGSFPLAVILPLLAFAGDVVDRQESLWRWLPPAAAAGAGTLWNPRGLEVWWYVVDVAGSAEARATVTEWWPTALWAPHGLGALFWGSIALLTVVTLFNWRHWTAASEETFASTRVEATDLLIPAAFAVLAALQRRSLLWWGLVFPWACSMQLGILRRRLLDTSTADAPDDSASRLPLIMAIGLVILGLALQPVWQWRVDVAADTGMHDVRGEPPLKGLVPADLPVEATYLIKQSGRPRTFHAQPYAGYLMFRLTDERPAQQVFVDHRIELPPSRIWDEFRETSRGQQWRGTFRKYAIGSALLKRQTQAALIDDLTDAPDWRRAYSRADHVLFLPETNDDDDESDSSASTDSAE